MRLCPTLLMAVTALVQAVAGQYSYPGVQTQYPVIPERYPAVPGRYTVVPARHPVVQYPGFEEQWSVLDYLNPSNVVKYFIGLLRRLLVGMLPSHFLTAFVKRLETFLMRIIGNSPNPGYQVYPAYLSRVNVYRPNGAYAPVRDVAVGYGSAAKADLRPGYHHYDYRATVD